MDVMTSRFGKLEVAPEDVLVFEQGVIGLRNLHDWVLLADWQNPRLGWLQSINAPDMALGLVNPRYFVADYRVRVGRRDVDGLHLAQLRDAQVAVVVNRCSEGLAINLRAPLVINVDRRLGRQVVVRDDYPVRQLLTVADAELRRSA